MEEGIRSMQTEAFERFLAIERQRESILRSNAPAAKEMATKALEAIGELMRLEEGMRNNLLDPTFCEDIALEEAARVLRGVLRNAERML